MSMLSYSTSTLKVILIKMLTNINIISILRLKRFSISGAKMSSNLRYNLLDSLLITNSQGPINCILNV